LPFVKF